MYKNHVRITETSITDELLQISTIAMLIIANWLLNDGQRNILKRFINDVGVLGIYVSSPTLGF
jgi:hypothetical protein